MAPETDVKQEPEMKAAQNKEEREQRRNNDLAYRSEDLRSLNDYYRIKKLPAARFLAALKKNKVAKFQDDDYQRCLDGLDEQDPEFARTLDLLFRAASASSPLAKQCIAFATQACSQQMVKHYRIAPDLNTSANAFFAEVFHGLKSGLIGSKTNRRSVNLLKAVGIWMSHSRNLDEVETIGFLAKELLSQKAKRSGGIPAAFEILLRPAIKIRVMSDMLRVAEHGLSKAQHARESEIKARQQRDRESSRAQDYFGQLSSARAELERKAEEIAALGTKLQASNEKRAALETRIEHQQAISVHGEGELRGRSRVFLENKLSPLLATAREFAELDPPRTGTIVERLEMAQEEIRNEIEWLRFTD